MGDARIYSAQTIEELQQEVNTYKETLSALKNGNSVEEILFKNKDFAYFKEKTRALETLIESIHEKQNKRIDTYKKEISTLSEQIEALHLVVEELTKKNTKATSKDSKNLTPKPPTAKRKTTSEPTEEPQHVIPSYQQLQKMVTQAQSIEDLQDGTAQETNRNQQKELQNPSFHNTQPLNKNRKPFNNLNEPATKRISYKFNNINAYPLPVSQKMTETAITKTNDKEPNFYVSNEKETEFKQDSVKKTEEHSINERLTQKLDELLESDALIQKIETLYKKEQAEKISENEMQKTNNFSISEPKTEVKEESIEASSLDKEQESTHNPASSFLNFFRKK